MENSLDKGSPFNSDVTENTWAPCKSVEDVYSRHTVSANLEYFGKPLPTANLQAVTPKCLGGRSLSTQCPPQLYIIFTSRLAWTLSNLLSDFSRLQYNEHHVLTQPSRQ
ncbi:hypothetical protein TNCV_2875082 [Trichonephila clavipes]|nr:hypothetical protein TNCV_2875082 [Trichonephila clavipes]